MQRLVVANGRGAAVAVSRGQTITVADSNGGQVADTWAFLADDPKEFLSAEHTRVHVGRLFPQPGQEFVTNKRRPVLRWESDLSPGIHDMLVAACDPTRYVELGAPGHASCQANLQQALGSRYVVTPQPVNLFMNSPFLPDGELRWLFPESRAGDYVTMTALLDVVLVVSACPQDLTSVNSSRGDIAISIE
jgi:uncharacterized protein YcgI (DUF1989 family)